MKRILSVLMALAILAGCLSVCAFAVNVNFADVAQDDYFYDSVQWAYENGITTGKSETQFAPNDHCLREQVVMFLWRAKGCPEPNSTENPFADVPAGSLYEKAILWAYHSGITTGTSETTFDPGASCTRGQIVTFLHRANGQPAAAKTDNPFSDVQADAYYEKAVLWAYHGGITTGMTNTTFEPDTICTRAQIVTFLYRDIANQSEKPKCPDCEENASGMTFSKEEQYQLTSPLESLPLTFEAVFSITEDQLPEGRPSSSTQRPQDTTSLLSADNKFNPCVIYSVDYTGKPVVFLRNEDYGSYYTYSFNKVNVATGEPVHMSIVLDFANKSIHCYINGELAQTITGIKVTKAFVQPWAPMVGGDLRNGNATYFRGTIDSMALWSDIRTAEEIAADYAGKSFIGDSELLAAYDLTRCEKCRVEDHSDRNNDLVYIDLWMTKEEVEPVGEFDYSFAVVGDTQTLCRMYPEHMEGIYDWILENQESQKIAYVLGMGDITDASKDFEWENATAYISKLNNRIPYLLARGNHDFWDDMNRAFHNGYYENTLDGMMEEREIIITQDEETGDIETVTGDITNAYQCATIGGTDYLFMTIDFAPGDAMLDWACDVIEAHPDHRVIVVTHAYMYRDGTTISKGDAYPCTWYPTGNGKPFPLSYYENPYSVNDGDHMWEKVFSQYENVLMVLSGHDPWQHIVYRQDTGVHGNTVTQMLIDPQYVDLEDEPSGLVAMFYFSNNGDTLTVRYYSVSKDCYGSPQSQFTIDLV